jgi:peptidase M1-like protein
VTIVLAQTGRLKRSGLPQRALTAALALALSCACAAQATGPANPGPAESLYLQLHSAGLDKSQVYTVREASLDRGALHIALDSGTIAFTESVGGHVTGAFFNGDGEILLMPPNNVERGSLAFFTGAAILEERFSVAYFRFNDDTFSELKPSLRPPENAEAFVSQWNPAAQNLAGEDALRLLISFSNQLSGMPPAVAAGKDRLLHAFIQGERLGTFDVRYDSMLPEQISVGQHKTEKGVDYYDTWASFALPSPAKAEADSELSESPPSDFVISRFKIQAQIQPPTQLEATASLTISPKKTGATLLILELSRLLQVKSAEADGRPVEFIHNPSLTGSQLARRGDDMLAIYLPGGLHSGRPVELTIRYSGSVLSEAANGLLYVGEHGTWYPNAGFVMSWFDLEFRYPVGWTLVATGNQTEAKAAGTEQVSHWVSERPVPVAGFNLGRYARNVTRAGAISVDTYATSTVERGFPATTAKDALPVPGIFQEHHVPPLAVTEPSPPSPSQNSQMVGAAAARALEFYQEHFGPFPYSELSLTQFPGRISQGWPGLIFLSSYAFLSPQELEEVQNDPKLRLLTQQIIAHETAHQWWGDLVIWNSYRDQWTSEALANYSALMLLQSQHPLQFHTVLQQYRDDLLQKDADITIADAGPVTLGVRLSSSKLPQAYEAISYGRGTWLLHMLRTMLRDAEPAPAQHKAAGDDLFLRTLRKLRTQYEGKPLSSAQLIAALEPELPRSLWYEGHKSLAWFYDSWVNGSAIPKFGLHDLKFAEKAGTTTVSGTIVQDDAPDWLVTSVPLYASIAGRNVFLGRVFAEGQETSFHISAPRQARKIVIDPEHTLLSRN